LVTGERLKRKLNAETRSSQRREKIRKERPATVGVPYKCEEGEGGAMIGMLGMMALQQHVVIVEWQRGLIGWLLIGLLAGWLAGKMARGRGFGCIGDILIGLIGSVIGGWIFTQLGIGHTNTFLYSLAAATIGAVLLVSVTHLFFGGKS
jgi:uncharacterized membrane protein YeaQ/YmgE (transglycosylase-associated protein family)